MAQRARLNSCSPPWHPDPTGHRKEGYAATTDANLVLGRILPEFFPKIFGKTEDQALDQSAAEAALDELAAHVNAHAKEGGQAHMSRDEVGFNV